MQSSIYAPQKSVQSMYNSYVTLRNAERWECVLDLQHTNYEKRPILFRKDKCIKIYLQTAHVMKTLINFTKAPTVKNMILNQINADNMTNPLISGQSYIIHI